MKISFQLKNNNIKKLISLNEFINFKLNLCEKEKRNMFSSLLVIFKHFLESIFTQEDHIS